MRKATLILGISLTLLLLLSFAFASANDLVLYLPLDGNADDASGNENDAEIFGNENWVDGKFGQAMEFDGSTYMEVPDNVPGFFDNITELTIEVWVNQSTHHENGIVVKLATAGVDWPCCYNLETWSDQLAYFGVNAAAGGYATMSYPLDEWFHFAGVFENGNVYIYVNGELGNSVVEPTDTITDSDGPVYIGCVETGRFYFIGKLDEVAMYNQALSVAEIQEDMNSGITMAVESNGKLVTTWAAVKAQR